MPPLRSPDTRAHRGTPLARRAALVACVSFALVASCTVPATQILVTVDTDFYVPSEIDTVRVRVLYASDAEGEPEEARAFETPPPLDAPTDARVILGGRVHELRRTVDFALGPAGSTLPIELSLVPSAGDEGRVARIEAYGLRDGAVRAIASVRTRFARHRTSRIPLTLFVACDSIRCEAGETCGPGGACIPNEVDPSCLDDPRLCPDAAAPARPDAALPDAALPDAAPPDASTDAASNDRDAGFCGDGRWDPATEACDGTADCSATCILTAPATTGTCASPIVIAPTGRHSASFAGHSDELTSPTDALNTATTPGRGRDLVWALDLGATPVDVEVTSDDLSDIHFTLSTECPTLGAAPRCVGGASSRRVPASGHRVVARGATGRLYVVASQRASAGSSDYARSAEIGVATSAAVAFSTLCSDPYRLHVGGVLLLAPPLRASELDVSCAPAASGELHALAPASTSLRDVVVSSSDGRARVVWSTGCGSAPAPCVSPATECTGLGSLLGQVLPSDTLVLVDGIGASTTWVGLTFY